MERLPALLCRLPRAQPLLPHQALHTPQLHVFTRSMAFKARSKAPKASATASKASINPDAPRIHILGAGNLGQYLARGLRKQNPQLPVTLLFHRAGLLEDWKAAGEEIECVADGAVDRTGGIDVELLGGGEGEAAPIRHLIVACKTYMAVSALQKVQGRLDEKSTIVFLQNGMGTTEEVTKELFPNAATRPTYWAGIGVLGVTSTKPFAITPAGRGHMTLGPVVEDIKSHQPDSSSHRPDNFLIQQLEKTEYPTASVVTHEKVRTAQVLKLVANSIINPLTVILGRKNGELIAFKDDGKLDAEDPVNSLVEALVMEAGPVVRSLLPPSGEGVGGEETFSDATLMLYVKEVIEKTAGNTSSMLQDVRNGKTTEIDYINGFIVAEGERLGHPCEKHAILVDMVKKGEKILPGGIKSRFGLKKGMVGFNGF